MARLVIRLLGPFEAILDGAPAAHFETIKDRALLAYLAVERDRRHRREALAEVFWPGRPEGQARANLRHSLAKVRRAIGDRKAEPPFLLTTRETLQINPEASIWVDVAELAGPTTFDDQSIRDLECIVELYRGAFLEDLSLAESAAYEEWLLASRERYGRRILDALSCLVERCVEGMELDQALDHALRHVELAPWDEHARRQAMHLLARTGRRTEALRQFQECKRLLQGELGLSPSKETTDLYEEIRAGAVDGEAEPPVRHNLPAHLDRFVGRETELDTILSRLREPDCRLLTLVGPGGIGKTRLALEAAGRARDVRPALFERGVFLVRLGPLQSAGAIVPAIAEAIGFQFRQGDPLQRQLLDYLQNKQMLLLLDSFEHLLDGTNHVTKMLQRAPDLKILVTSRASLQLRGEHLIPVAGMKTPDPAALETGAEVEAVRLFVQRARQTRLGADWLPTPEELAAAIHICRLVGGMPLGILLAAAWVEMLSPAEIAAEIDQGLDFLITDRQDVPERQRSLRAAFDHSWSLLTKSEREQFQQLCVFHGSFSRQAALAVTGTSLLELRALMGKSLLQGASVGRYEIHAMLRQYGLEALDRSPESRDAIHDRHSAYFAERLASWAVDMKGERQQVAIEEIESDLENVRAAWQWAAQFGPLARIEMALDGIGLYHEHRLLLGEGEAAFRVTERLLKRSSSPDGRRLWAKMLAFQARYAWEARNVALARELSQQALAILESLERTDHDVRPEMAMTLSTMGYASLNLEEKERLFQRSLAISRELAGDWEVARALRELAWVVRTSGDYERARQLASESLTILQRLGDPRGIADVLALLGNIVLRQGEHERGVGLLRETISVLEELGQQRGCAYYRGALGTAYAAQGHRKHGVSLLRESVQVLGDCGAEEQSNWWRIWLAVNLSELGEYEAARLEAGIAHSYYTGANLPRETAHVLYALARAAMGTGSYTEARRLLEEASAILRRMGNRESLALALTYLAFPMMAQGDLTAAGDTLAQGLALASEVGALNALFSGVPALALLRACQGRSEQAVELYSAARSSPRVRGSRWFDDVVGVKIAAAAATLPPEVATAARRRGQGRDPKVTVLGFLAN